MAKDLPIYKITIDPQYAEDGEDLGIEQNSIHFKPCH